MIIEINENEYLQAEESFLIEKVIQATAAKLQLNAATEVDVSIVSNEVIHQLNQQYRGIDRPTDVLSFALEEDLLDAPRINSGALSAEEIASLPPRHLGDIIISYPQALEQAEEYQHSIERELAFLAVHGFLHLNGYDHQTPAEEAVMFALQEEVLVENGYQR